VRVKLALENSTLPWHPNISVLLGLSSMAVIIGSSTSMGITVWSAYHLLDKRSYVF